MDFYEVRAGEYTIHVPDNVRYDPVAMFDKALDTVSKFGFQGFSRGKRNGVFFIGTGDAPIEGFLERFLVSREEGFVNSFGIKPSDLRRIKVVHHRTDGKRLVGFILNKDIYLVGVGSY